MNELESNVEVNNDEELDYRTIANVMTKNGFKMNHSSVRNYIIRIMKKILVAYAKKNNVVLDDSTIDQVAKSSEFHRAIANVLQSPTHK